MQQRLTTTLALALVALAGPASAQPAAPTLLDRLVGKWVLTGVLSGKETTHDVDAEWVLNREYVRLHEVSREKDNRGGPAYEAIIFIAPDPKTGEYVCLWLDNTEGGGLSNDGLARGKPTADSIPFVFFPGTRNAFHNTFVYSTADDTWKWIMDGESDGQLHPFARLTLTRAKPR